MAHYLMGVWHYTDYADQDLDSPEIQHMFAQVGAFNEKLQSAGAWVFAGGLGSATFATVVRSTDNGVSMTDGPYAETKEQLGGFWVIDAADLDAALEWAGQASAACERPIEVRSMDSAPTPEHA